LVSERKAKAESSLRGVTTTPTGGNQQSSIVNHWSFQLVVKCGFMDQVSTIGVHREPHTALADLSLDRA
jgi:hypothetical protein